MSSGVGTGRRYFWFPPVAVVVLLVLIAAGCDFPRDPRGTLEGVQNGTMRVGIVENNPWTRMEEGHASGVEVELLKDFARELGAEASFVPGTTPELLEAAKVAEVDVLIGGFTSTSPGVSEGKEAGVTGSYLTTRFVVGVPSGRPTFDDLSGREIAVERIDATAAVLKGEGAVPVPVDDLSTTKMPVAAYRWQLKAWGFKPTGVELPEEEYVMAVPLGENGWLVELERFLRAHRGETKSLLRKESS
jgi:polar amino acid transport system substrate-binding protein